jgi:hypothetical protein
MQPEFGKFLRRHIEQQGELSAGVRKSEKVSLRDPIMPIDDGFGG